MRSVFHRRWMLAFCISLSLLTGADPAKEEPFRPIAGQFPPIEKAKFYRGELVFVDHVNRRGSLRLHVDGHFGESKPHHFAMLPYGIIRYRGAPADLRDIPLGTIMYGKFYLPPDPKISSVPNRTKGTVTQPAETYAILLEDDPSFCMRERKSWKLKEIELQKNEGTILASLDRKEVGEGLKGDHKMTIDGSTRIWRGRERLALDDLLAEGLWPTNGKKSLGDQPVQLALAWHPRYLYQQFHVSDIWLDDTAMQQAAKAQAGWNNRFIKTRWMPAWVDSMEYGKFGRATVTATLFGGMDPSLYADFKKGVGGQMAAAEATLRTYWPDHDGMEGIINEVIKVPGEPPLGSSGFQIRFEMDLVLEGFRPGRIVKIRPQNWPKAKPPREECIHGHDERWPSPSIFSN